jgi:ABC-type phosphate/phosphonate transport system substrate-binding protein
MACTFPAVRLDQATETPAPLSPTDTASPPPASPSTELGLAENPLILALPPGADSQAEIDAANVIAAQLTERTGYVVVTVIPDSNAALVDALGRGNAHIAVLEPFAYELAHQKGSVKAAFAVVEDGTLKYGAQFLAPRKAGFTSYFNPLNETNTINDARIALSQFNDKKPCWSDETSLSGYVIPLGYINSIGIATKPAALVEGHPSVVRALYAGGICDFGATYIDARKFPSLEDEFPDLIEQVIVIWRIPEIIPHRVLAFSSAMPQTMRDLFSGTIPAVLQTEAGRNAYQTVYEIEALAPVNDASYNEFREYVIESRVDLAGLMK